MTNCLWRYTYSKGKFKLLAFVSSDKRAKQFDFIENEYGFPEYRRDLDGNPVPLIRSITYGNE